MATERAIAIMRAGAMERLEKAASALAKELEGVKGFDKPLAAIHVFGGDIELVHARQLEAVADVLDGVVEAVKKQPAETGDESLEEDFTDAQTQLLALKKNEPAVPADNAKPKGK